MQRQQRPRIRQVHFVRVPIAKKKKIVRNSRNERCSAMRARYGRARDVANDDDDYGLLLMMLLLPLLVAVENSRFRSRSTLPIINIRVGLLL